MKEGRGIQNSGISFIVSSIHTLEICNRLESVVTSSRRFLTSPEEIIGMHFFIALGKLVSFLFQQLELSLLKQLRLFILFYGM